MKRDTERNADINSAIKTGDAGKVNSASNPKAVDKDFEKWVKDQAVEITTKLADTTSEADVASARASLFNLRKEVEKAGQSGKDVTEMQELLTELDGFLNDVQNFICDMKCLNEEIEEYNKSKAKDADNSNEKKSHEDDDEEDIAKIIDPRDMAICNLDGAFFDASETFGQFFGEFGLASISVLVEISWMVYLINFLPSGKMDEIRETMNADDVDNLMKVAQRFDNEDFMRIMSIMYDTEADYYEAIERFIGENLGGLFMDNLTKYVHIGDYSRNVLRELTYACAMNDALAHGYFPVLKAVCSSISKIAHKYVGKPIKKSKMNPDEAYPTLGKEISEYAHKLEYQFSILDNIPIYGNLRNDSGSYEAYSSLFPDIYDWQSNEKAFLEDFLALSYDENSEKANPYNATADIMRVVHRINEILKKFAKDMYSYISDEELFSNEEISNNEVRSEMLAYLKESADSFEFGNYICRGISKINNASKMNKGGISNTVMKNIGMSFGYSMLGIKFMMEFFKMILHDAK